MKRSNVSIFVPFAGCKNRCSFCDQHSITGVIRHTTPDDVRAAAGVALSSGGIDAKCSEIAFFGGSFTAIDRSYMISLLEAANEFISFFGGIRISTRPDCIDEETLDILKKYNVTAIELGAQSMCDDVLMLNSRGHNSDCVRTASELIKSYGFSLGLQMMTGLYGSDDEKDIYTATEFIRLKPDTVRIYPTVVLDKTGLADYYREGVYTPRSVEDAVLLCSRLIPMFEAENITVIRVGLHASDTLSDQMIGGAYHPAFRELCENKIFFDLILRTIGDKNIKKGDIIIRVSPGNISKAAGQRRSNINKLVSLGYNPKIVEDSELINRQIIIQEG